MGTEPCRLVTLPAGEVAAPLDGVNGRDVDGQQRGGVTGRLVIAARRPVQVVSAEAAQCCRCCAGKR